MFSYDIVIISFLTFSITSMYLYSEIFKESREFVLSLSKYENFILKKLSYLGVCQLCVSFWVSLILQYALLDYTLLQHFIIAFMSAGISWLLGAMTTMFLWIRAACEDFINNKR